MDGKVFISIILLSSLIVFSYSTQPNSSNDPSTSSVVGEISTQLTKALNAAMAKLAQDEEVLEDAENAWDATQYNSSQYTDWEDQVSKDSEVVGEDEESVRNLTLALEVLVEDPETLFNSTAVLYSAPSNIQSNDTEELSSLEFLEQNDDQIANKDSNIIEGSEALVKFISEAFNSTGINQETLDGYVQQIMNVSEKVSGQYNQVFDDLSTIDYDVEMVGDYEIGIEFPYGAEVDSYQTLIRADEQKTKTADIEKEIKQ